MNRVLVALSLLFALIASECGALVVNSRVRAASRTGGARSLRMEYIPDGLTKSQWDKIKKKEKDAKKNLKFDGTSGMKFRSRSMADFLEGREKGLFKYNMPMEGDVKKMLREGKIKPEDVPYMQRPGGMPDNSDLKKGPFKNVKWPWEKNKQNGNGW